MSHRVNQFQRLVESPETVWAEINHWVNDFQSSQERFTLAELLELKAIPWRDTTLLNYLVTVGYRVTYAEILTTGNPANSIGVTLAHWEAFRGHCFSLAELRQIGPVQINFSFDDLIDREPPAWFQFHYCRHRDAKFDFEHQIMPYHDGASVGHLMVRCGHQFTKPEIQQLGNPRDARGKTLADWQQKIKTH